MKPKSVEVYPIYICPSCESRHVESLDYVNKVGKILCHCDQLITLDKIKTFNITPVYLSEKKKREKKKREWPPARKTWKEIQQEEFWEVIEDDVPEIKCITEEASEQCMELLTSLGWSVRESKSKISKISKEWSEQKSTNIDADNFEEFANYLLFNKC